MVVNMREFVKMIMYFRRVSQKHANIQYQRKYVIYLFPLQYVNE